MDTIRPISENSPGKALPRLRRVAGLVLALAGLSLLSLTLYGRFADPRDPAIYSLNQGKPHGVTLTYAEFLENLPRRAGEGARDYAARLNTLVNRGMAHHWDPDGTGIGNIVVPPWENWLIWLDSLDEKDRRYEFGNPFRAMERGVGLCSQHAMALFGFLVRAGMEAKIQDLQGHVVVLAGDEAGRWRVLDPDNGVALPMDMAVIERDPARIIPHYSRHVDGKSLRALVRLYGREGNRAWDYDIPRTWRDRLFNHQARKYNEEARRYVMIWLIPLLMIAGGLLLLKTPRKRQPEAQDAPPPKTP